MSTSSRPPHVPAPMGSLGAISTPPSRAMAETYDPTKYGQNAPWAKLPKGFAQVMAEHGVAELANQRQVGGAHYSTPIQHWDFAAANQYDYFQGQITKYVDRWKRKNGLQDLQKAAHFLQKYLEIESAKVEAEEGRIADREQAESRRLEAGS